MAYNSFSLVWAQSPKHRNTFPRNLIEKIVPGTQLLPLVLAFALWEELIFLGRTSLKHMLKKGKKRHKTVSGTDDEDSGA